MKKYVYIIIIGFLGLTSCEKDDFCTQNPITPNLILRFHDKDDTTKKKSVERFSIIAVGKTDSLFVNSTTDSIAIPLNGLNTQTVYTLKMNDVDNIKVNNKIATLTINYTTEEEYISRSCGYRFIYKNVTLTSSNPSWISSLSSQNVPVINNQIKAHAQVFH